MNWESLDWEVLDRLRENFLSGISDGGPYWHTLTDLECYDFTYGERIGWKWDAVLRELRLRQWMPGNGSEKTNGLTLLDWGCGSGVAGRRVVDFFGARNFACLFVHDHSPLALDFAEHHGRKAFPLLNVERASRRFLQSDEPIGILVVSHVLNELDDSARTELMGLCARASSILWVEPGTHEISRALGGWREKLRAAGLNIVAPCTHQAPCGMFTAGNERHWCHFFAAPPGGIQADSGWVKFGQRAGIDLRSLPYSFLVLDRPAPGLRSANQLKLESGEQTGFSRIIGEPRHYKGYAKIFNCDAGGVAELMLQKRTAPELFKALKHEKGPMIYRWTHEDKKIIAVE